MKPAKRLVELGIELPPVATPAGAYVPAVRDGDLVWSSGQIPFQHGELLAVGKVGHGEGHISPELAYDLARVAALNAIAAIAAVAVDTTLVRVPKLGAFLRAGALVGVVVGLILGFWMSAPSLINRWIFITLTVVFVTLVVGLLAAGLYVYLDKRARAKAHR